MKLVRSETEDGVGKYMLVPTRRMRHLRAKIEALKASITNGPTSVAHAEEEEVGRLAGMEMELRKITQALATLEAADSLITGDNKAPDAEKFFVIRFKDKFALPALLAYVEAVYDSADAAREESRRALTDMSMADPSSEKDTAAQLAAREFVNTADELEEYATSLMHHAVTPIRRLAQENATKLPD